MGPVSIQVTLKRGNSLGLCPFSSYLLHLGLPTPSLPGWPGHYYRGPPYGPGLWMALAFQILTCPSLQLPWLPTLVSLSWCLSWGPSVRWMRCNDTCPWGVHSLVPEIVL